MLPIAFPIAAWFTVQEMWKQNTLNPILLKARFSYNVNIKLVGKDGKFKDIFCTNFLGKFLSLFGIKNEHLWLGEYKSELNFANLLTNVSFAFFASRIGGDGAEPVAKYIALGTGTTPAAVGDTTLETETSAAGLARAEAAISRVTSPTGQTNDTTRAIELFTNTSGGDVAVTEVGLLNAAAVGVLVGHKVFATQTIGNGDGVQVTYDIKCSV